MPASRRRTATKLLRLHPEELARITARAEACGVNPARFIRETALGAVRKARHHAESDRLVHALARLSWSLEQAMRIVRSGGNPEVAERLAEIRDDHRALVAHMVALRAPNRPKAFTDPTETLAAWPGRPRGRPPASGPGAPSPDQLTIDFNCAGSRSIRVTSSRGARVTRALASDPRARGGPYGTAPNTPGSKAVSCDRPDQDYL